MATLLHALAFLLAAAAFGVALSSMPHVLRARREGVPFWYGGLGWYGAPSRHVPDAARPHALKAMRRWWTAMALFVLAALMAGLGALQN
jgi:membrane-associated phospholipid phosphatase